MKIAGESVRLYFLALMMCACASLIFGQKQEDQEPDTLLILKNGAEVRGVFLGLKAGQYSLRLVDGRIMSYLATDVERMERIREPKDGMKAQEAQAPHVQTAPFVCRTFITEKDLDKTFYTFVQRIKAKKNWYGSPDIVYERMVAKARELGADAIISFDIHYSPSIAGAWATPHAEGIAVRWTDAGRKALPILEGRCY
jgi:uncharacterized protein YbjQ (UPF0145 family)